MGYVIFEQSGTFKPSDFGLVTGDTLQIVCVGGGASGCERHNAVAGNPGGASSFGSYVTAPGALAPTSSGVQAQTVIGGRAGLNIYDSNLSPIWYTLGAPGWMPYMGWVPWPEWQWSSEGKLLRLNGFTGPQVKLNSFSSTLAAAAATLPAFAKKTRACAGSGCSSNAGYHVGGYGYGSGGGGGGSIINSSSNNSSMAGNSGGVVEGIVTLASTANIAVTVGLGGANVIAPSTASNNTRYFSGEGADGCVCVFW